MAKRAAPKRRAVKTSRKSTASKSTGAGRGPAARARRAAKRKTAARAAATRSIRRRPKPKAARKSPAATLARAAAGAVASLAARLPWVKDENDPFILLETDHRRFENLLKRGEETTARGVKRRTQLLDTLTAELNIHETIEEKVLYPALEPLAQARDIVLEGVQEHHVADLILAELHQLARNDEQWGAKFKVLKESIEHHLEEEENKMFPTARTLLSREELSALGVQMKKLKAELEA